MHNLEARGLEHLLGRFLHVLSHAVLVVAKFIVKTQGGDSPLVLHHGIKVDIVFIARQNLTESAHTNVRSLILANFFFEGRAEAVRVRAVGKHGAAAAALESIAADEFRVLLRKMAEAGQGKAAGPAVSERWRLADEILGAAGDARPHNMFAEIVADVAAGVC